MDNKNRVLSVTTNDNERSMIQGMDSRLIEDLFKLGLKDVEVRDYLKRLVLNDCSMNYGQFESISSQLKSL